MSDQKHTPGPWTFDGDNPINQGFDVALPDGGTLATAYYCEDGEGRAVAEANARLIAAAPDLLAACEAALPRIVGCSVMDCRGTGREGCRLCAVRSQVKDAIRKARHKFSRQKE